MIPEARLYNFKARVYDPGLGRFLQTDPIGYASDINVYGYVRNDPLARIDPNGPDLVLAGVGLVYGAINGGLVSYTTGNTSFQSVTAVVFSGGFAGGLSGLLNQPLLLGAASAAAAAVNVQLINNLEKISKLNLKHTINFTESGAIKNKAASAIIKMSKIGPQTGLGERFIVYNASQSSVFGAGLLAGTVSGQPGSHATGSVGDSTFTGTDGATSVIAGDPGSGGPDDWPTDDY